MRTYTRPRLVGEIAREIAEILELYLFTAETQRTRRKSVLESDQNLKVSEPSLQDFSANSLPVPHGTAARRVCAVDSEYGKQIPGVRGQGPGAPRRGPTVMAVGLSSSGEAAVVSVCVDEALEDRGEFLAALARDRGFFRTQLARRLAVRRVPWLTFVLDETLRSSYHEGAPERGWDA